MRGPSSRRPLGNPRPPRLRRPRPPPLAHRRPSRPRLLRPTRASPSRALRPVLPSRSAGRGRDEFCELLIVLDGKIPQAQSTLLECESYDLFENAKVGPTPTFQAHFESQRQRYRVTNWDAFDPR